MALGAALVAAPLIMGGINFVSGLFRSHKINKQRKLMEKANAAQMAQMRMMVAQAQGQSMGAMGGVGANFLQPSGCSSFGPAPQGYYPGFC